MVDRVVLLFLFGAIGCSNALTCDPIDPALCMLPWPNNFYTVPDQASPTGLRLNLDKDTFPKNIVGMRVDAEKAGFNSLDGFSPASPIMVYLGDVDTTDLPTWKNIGHASSKTLLLDVTTGEKIPHWIELDASSMKGGMFYDEMEAGVASTKLRMLLLWPAKKLQNARRYIVAFRNITSTSGSKIEPSPAFRCFRDNACTSDPDVNKRRPLFEEIFDAAGKAGVGREEMVVAWDFTTGSTENLTGRLRFIRDDATRRIEKDGLAYTITDVHSNHSQYIDRKITGYFEAPLYLNLHGLPGSHFVLDANDMPVYQGTTKVDFVMMIPRSLVASETAGSLLQYGHGLFGSRDEVEDEYLQQIADREGIVVFAVDWWGLSHTDVPALVVMLGTNLANFRIVPDRLAQGVCNALLMMKLASGELSRDKVTQSDNGKPLVDSTKRFYYGNSCGGIMGSVYMAVTQDVERGVLGVAGAPFSLLLPRSLDFSQLFTLLKVEYLNSLSRIALITIFQQLWDRSSPAGYIDKLESGELTSNNVSSRLPHRVILQYGIGDSQVSLLGTYTLGRSIGTKMFAEHAQEADETVYGFEMVDNSEEVQEGSMAVPWDFAVPLIPSQDVPPPADVDVHELPRRQRAAQDQMIHFFRTGIIKDFCNGVCKGQK